MSLFDIEESKNTAKKNCGGSVSEKSVSFVQEKKQKQSKALKIKDVEEKEIGEINRRELKKISSFFEIEDRILNQFCNGKMHHATMLSGKYGIGKATFAYWLASRMILSSCKDEEREMHIELLTRNIHPDVMFLELSEGENEIKIEQVRILLEKIMIKSTYGNKFVIIDDINSVNKNGVNALLKTLEEPPANTYFFLINHKISRLLDTIYSRCNEIKMRLSHGECMKVLQQMHTDWLFDDVEFYANISDNSINFANLAADFGLKTIIVNGLKNEKLNLPNLLNVLYGQIERNCKTLSRVLKQSFLEKILMYLISENINFDIAKNCECILQIVKQNTQLLKQFADIKLFDLPVRFV